jgi:L-asparaginase
MICLSENKKIKLISTGGTIACVPTEQGLAPGLSALEMLRIIEADTDSIDCLDLFSMDSSNIQPEEWQIIANEILRSINTKEYAGIVVTHGTDTMAYTASILSFMLRGTDIPIVITGAQLPIINEDSDGRINLYDSIIAAQGLKAGVYICFGGDVILGCRAVKTRTVSYNAFESINLPKIAEIKNRQIIFISEYTLKSNGETPISDAINPNVALIKLIPGMSADFIKCSLSCNLLGVVVEGFGLGGVHNIRRDHNEALEFLMKNGVCVVLTSQCLYETSALDVYAVSRRLLNAGAISAHDMTTEAAVTKLMWALGATSPLPTEQRIEKVNEIFSTNFCGEITL